MLLLYGMIDVALKSTLMVMYAVALGTYHVYSILKFIEIDSFTTGAITSSRQDCPYHCSPPSDRSEYY